MATFRLPNSFPLWKDLGRQDIFPQEVQVSLALSILIRLLKPLPHGIPIRISLGMTLNRILSI